MDLAYGLMKEEKKIYGTPDEDEFLLDIGLKQS